MQLALNLAVIVHYTCLFVTIAFILKSATALLFPAKKKGSEFANHRSQVYVQQDISTTHMACFSACFAAYGWAKYQIETDGVVTELSKLLLL